MTLSELIRRTNHPDGPVICLDVATVRVLVECAKAAANPHKRGENWTVMQVALGGLDLDLSTIELPPAAEGSA